MEVCYYAIRGQIPEPDFDQISHLYDIWSNLKKKTVCISVTDLNIYYSKLNIYYTIIVDIYWLIL